MKYLRSPFVVMIVLALWVGVPGFFALPASAQDSVQDSVQESVQESAPPATTTVILVRHAEKAKVPEGDPALNMAGQARAGRLVRMVEGAGVTALYATDRRRTQETLQPLAAKLGLEIGTVAAQDTEAMAKVALGHPGGVVVIAAHSNTLGPIIEALGAPAIAPIPEMEYENFFVVTVGGDGEATVLRLLF